MYSKGAGGCLFDLELHGGDWLNVTTVSSRVGNHPKDGLDWIFIFLFFTKDDYVMDFLYGA